MDQNSTGDLHKDGCRITPLANGEILISTKEKGAQIYSTGIYKVTLKRDDSPEADYKLDLVVKNKRLSPDPDSCMRFHMGVLALFATPDRVMPIEKYFECGE